VQNMQKVTVLGTGVLGSQIIMQAAYHGKDVRAYDISDEILAKLPSRWEWMRGYYRTDLPDFTDEKFDAAIARISTSTVLADAVADADVIVEAVPENLDLKKKVWAQVGEAAPAGAIFATNTSSLMPSTFADSTGRPQRLGTLHFANKVWRFNTGEVMGHPGTDPAVLDALVQFATEIGLVPYRVRKESPGYLLNGLLIPFLQAGAHLYVDGVGSVADIDDIWRKATGSPQGPFQFYDVVGFNVAYNIELNKPEQSPFAAVLKRGIDNGKTGIADGEGFYTYDSDGKPTGVSSQFPEVWGS
jgi:3-hydroxyacyl-CoA dehydrogenase